MRRREPWTGVRQGSRCAARGSRCGRGKGRRSGGRQSAWTDDGWVGERLVAMSMLELQPWPVPFVYAPVLHRLLQSPPAAPDAWQPNQACTPSPLPAAVAAARLCACALVPSSPPSCMRFDASRTRSSHERRTHRHTWAPVAGGWWLVQTSHDHSLGSHDRASMLVLALARPYSFRRHHLRHHLSRTATSSHVVVTGPSLLMVRFCTS